MLEMMSSLCRRPRGKQSVQYEGTVQSDHPLSQRRQGPAVSGLRGCGGNRKRRSPAPQEHEGSEQLARLPPRRGGAPGWREAVGKCGGGGGGGVRGGCRVQAKQHSQRNISKTEGKILHFAASETFNGVNGDCRHFYGLRLGFFLFV